MKTLFKKRPNPKFKIEGTQLYKQLGLGLVLGGSGPTLLSGLPQAALLFNMELLNELSANIDQLRLFPSLSRPSTGFHYLFLLFPLSPSRQWRGSCAVPILSLGERGLRRSPATRWRKIRPSRWANKRVKNTSRSLCPQVSVSAVHCSLRVLFSLCHLRQRAFCASFFSV